MKSKFNFYLKQSLVYNYLQSFLSKLISFSASIILARILFVEDFGYILIAYTISSAIDVFSNVGLTSYYYQKSLINESDEEKILATTYFLTSILFFIVFCLKILLSLYIKYKHNDIIGDILLIQSFCIIFTIPNSIHTIRMQKKIKFKELSYANFLKEFFTSCTKCLLALTGLGPISVAYGELIGRLTKSIFFTLYDENLPTIRKIDKSKIPIIIYFGKHGFLSGFFSFLNLQMDKMFFSYMYSPFQLGVYNFGLQNGGIINQFFLAPQRKLLSSYLIIVKDDLKKFNKKLISISRLSTFIVLFFSFILYLNAEIFIKLIFGDKWIHSLSFLKLFILSGAVSSFFFSSNSLLQVFGYPQIISKIKIIKLPVFITILSISYFLKLEIYDTAVLFVAVNLLMSFFQQIISFKKIKIPIFGYYKNLTPIVLNYMFGLFICLLIGKFMNGSFSFIYQTIGFCFAYLIFGIVYLKAVLVNDYNIIKNKER